MCILENLYAGARAWATTCIHAAELEFLKQLRGNNAPFLRRLDELQISRVAFVSPSPARRLELRRDWRWYNVEHGVANLCYLSPAATAKLETNDRFRFAGRRDTERMEWTENP
jgi:hypothetical protein